MPRFPSEVVGRSTADDPPTTSVNIKADAIVVAHVVTFWLRMNESIA
jgi:hypothetical protein